jgi:hypothetical protein
MGEACVGGAGPTAGRREDLWHGTQIAARAAGDALALVHGEPEAPAEGREHRGVRACDPRQQPKQRLEGESSRTIDRPRWERDLPRLWMHVHMHGGGG